MLAHSGTIGVVVELAFLLVTVEVCDADPPKLKLILKLLCDYPRQWRIAFGLQCPLPARSADHQ